ncbi:DNA polymerase III subunit alpha [Buchnera aphidicola]|jgi:DNA polymerase-3 subunit alpha|uniref:DNA polymerase III subunit alpha n=1 Tax=Buchnera aphidicola subsp. Schizaphis graminum (strain Sg) TaxID=198804 RepID=DPO3A_BUCAP|nr:DNA polymerase III subunit alpha [Buchnera aphidicola]Q8K9S3.1 RecName: Full=DNA polymerase III subunit alpha [Buchnera aphidicola str. Sg (Schizaphis graminum)]AAM67792.1 DNA polymerase III alpha chain [Buchnera aphidicola str. Sg (Schizaphis graminum)]AWI49710.1 DNA polymerase III subunit alpha [Buchnera aphidicola (Schizaphis graminum)]
MNLEEFVHLHVHSDYSIVDGLSKPEDLIKKSVNLGMKALSITDFNNLYGAIKFYNAAHKWGLKPIIGVTVKFFSELIKNELTELTLLATNQDGYKNLILLISRAYKKGYFCEKYVTIEKKWLSELNNGLILLSGGCQGEIGKTLLRGQTSLISDCLHFYEKYFSGFYYLELIRTYRENEEKYLSLAVDLSYSQNIPVVATNDVCFLNKEDFKIHKIRIAINEGVRLKESKIQNNYSKHQFLKTEKEMCFLFSDIPEAIINSVEISKRCNVFIKSGQYFLPQFNTRKISIENYLIQKSNKGLKKRLESNFKKVDKEIFLKYKNRLDTELGIINKMGFPSYFLIVMEFIQWAKDNNIPVGPGRGSGAGSLVAYVLNITEVDPLFFDLLFERFLNPERISLPDFDIDFCMEKRDRVIEHVVHTYGRESVAQIITFGTMTAKAVIRDVGRVLGYPYGFINNLSKLVPLDPGITLKDAFSKNSELYTLYKSDEDIQNLIDVSKKLEGVNRNVGKHAGGVVISPSKITDFCPVYCDEKGNNPVTQFDKNDIEYVGLLKFDFLGLRTLTIINCAVNMINKNLLLSNKKTININSIPLNESKCFLLLKKCETTGIFQLESYGMKDLVKRLQPDCFEDIIALIALFRPGPLQSGMVDNFINRKHGYEEISYPDHKWQHILLKPVLESTYGIILYQEQVMQIAQILAGYTLGKADILRRAMSKKNIKDMAEQRSIFIEGAQKNGINRKLAIKIFDLLEKFAGYGFNKSHSVAYALVSYQTLWLKAHYPSEFMASAMTSDIDNTDKIVMLVNESIQMGIKIIPPNINLSKYEFYVDHTKNIVYGLGAVKGIGRNPILNLVQEREKNGLFSDLFDLCMRTDPNKITRKVLEKLIMSGSCDCFNKNRNYLLSLIEDAIKASKEHFKIKKFQQESLFGSFKEELNILKKNNNLLNSFSDEEKKLENEHKVLGLYLTGHPIDRYAEELKYYLNNSTFSKLKLFNHTKKKIMVAGIVVSIKTKVTKNKNRIVILILDDSTGLLEVVIFKRLLNISEKLIQLNKILIVSGFLNTNFISKNLKMTAYDIMNLNLAREKYLDKLTIVLTEKQRDKCFLKKIYQFFQNQTTGIVPVYIFCKKKDLDSEYKLIKKWLITISNKLLVELDIFSKENKMQIKYF